VYFAHTRARCHFTCRVDIVPCYRRHLLCCLHSAVSEQPKCRRAGKAMTSFDSVLIITMICDGEGFTGPRLCSPEVSVRLPELLPTVNRCASYRVSRKDARNCVDVSVERPRGNKHCSVPILYGTVARGTGSDRNVDRTEQRAAGSTLLLHK